jgi:hypothetical protein
VRYPDARQWHFDRVFLLMVVVAAIPATEVPTPSTVKPSPFYLAFFSFVSCAFGVVENVNGRCNASLLEYLARFRLLSANELTENDTRIFSNLPSQKRSESRGWLVRLVRSWELPTLRRLQKRLSFSPYALHSPHSFPFNHHHQPTSRHFHNFYSTSMARTKVSILKLL